MDEQKNKSESDVVVISEDSPITDVLRAELAKAEGKKVKVVRPKKQVQARARNTRP
jgi:hypothetical protein